MSVGAADERHVDHAREHQIVDVTAAAGQQARIIGARQASADVVHRARIGGRLGSAGVPRAFGPGEFEGGVAPFDRIVGAVSGPP